MAEQDVGIPDETHERLSRVLKEMAEQAEINEISLGRAKAQFGVKSEQPPNPGG
jgi:hypothetical protein